jgi:hypothetical protein
MPISPKNYAARAAKLEQIAATIADEATRNRYLKVAAELRKLAGEPDLLRPELGSLGPERHQRPDENRDRQKRQ